MKEDGVVANRYCGNCGQGLNEGDRFCPGCGRPVHETAHVTTPEADVPVPPPPSQRTPGTTPTLAEAPPRPRSVATRLLFVGCAGAVVLLVLAVGYLAVGMGGAEGGPSSSEVVRAFEDEGLTVIDPRPVQDGDLGMAPQTFEEGTHFVASTQEDLGAKVFTYESEDDLRQMQEFYEGFSGMFYSHVYTKDLVLVQINGQLPKSEADRYGEILERM